VQDESTSTKIIQAITRLETKMDAVLSRLNDNDRRFNDIDHRLRELEKTDNRMMGMGTIMMIIVPTFVSGLIAFLFRLLG
jgi:hypothetical protein